MSEKIISEAEDYSMFNLSAVESSLRDMLVAVREETGASEEEVLAAFSAAALRIMNINCLAEPTYHDRGI